MQVSFVRVKVNGVSGNWKVTDKNILFVEDKNARLWIASYPDKQSVKECVPVSSCYIHIGTRNFLTKSFSKYWDMPGE